MYIYCCLLSFMLQLMDLPCIIESHKTLDKKSLYKTGDICQVDLHCVCMCVCRGNTCMCKCSCVFVDVLILHLNNKQCFIHGELIL